MKTKKEIKSRIVEHRATLEYWLSNPWEKGEKPPAAAIKDTVARLEASINELEWVLE